MERKELVNYLVELVKEDVEFNAYVYDRTNERVTASPDDLADDNEAGQLWFAMFSRYSVDLMVSVTQQIGDRL